MATAESKYVTTSDGVKLHYVESGVGPALLMLHSWSGTAEQFSHQIAPVNSSGSLAVRPSHARIRASV
jgi:hypothetical protein